METGERVQKETLGDFGEAVDGGGLTVSIQPAENAGDAEKNELA
jgi:hypothetical protein